MACDQIALLSPSSMSLLLCQVHEECHSYMVLLSTELYAMNLVIFKFRPNESQVEHLIKVNTVMYSAT